MYIEILPELKKLIPPLTKEEYRGLEQSCIKEGIRDKLIVWQIPDEETLSRVLDGHKCYASEIGESEGECGYIELNDGVWVCSKCNYGVYPDFSILIDGHNRHEIATQHELKYETEKMDFDSIEEVKDWMIANQLGKRNLTKEQKSYLRGVQYEREKSKESFNGNRHTGSLVVDKVATTKTEEKLSEQHKVSPRTIRRDAKFAQSINKIAEIAGDEVRDNLLNREIKTTAKEINRIAALPKEKIEKVFTAIKEGETTNLKESIHKAAALDIKETPELEPGKKKYLVVYADPPWAYGNTMPNYFDEQADHYPLMTVSDIAKMPVKEIAENNAVLFLWVTSPILEESFEVVNSWGFKYKASFVWDKVKHNMGHYNSVRHELLLVCVKGSCQPQVRRLFNSVQSIERTNKHSEKPGIFREIIDTIYPKGNRIELFSRTKIENWDTYGNQIQ